jgi:hypothetical protein
MEHQRRDASLDSNDTQLPKLASGPFRPRNAMKNDECFSTLDVAGSIPVSRFIFKNIRYLQVCDPTFGTNITALRAPQNCIISLALPLCRKLRLNKSFRVVHSRRHEDTESDQARVVRA